MFAQIEATGNWSGVYMMLNYRGVDTSNPETLTRGDVDMLSLVPAYVLSELKVAFLMGFRIYMPFLVIDMVIASMLISMGMLMLPPVLISLPFKLLLFVLVDGWQPGRRVAAEQRRAAGHGGLARVRHRGRRSVATRSTAVLDLAHASRPPLESSLS